MMRMLLILLIVLSGCQTMKDSEWVSVDVIGGDTIMVKTIIFHESNYTLIIDDKARGISDTIRNDYYRDGNTVVFGENGKKTNAVIKNDSLIIGEIIEAPYIFIKQ